MNFEEVIESTRKELKKSGSVQSKIIFELKGKSFLVAMVFNDQKAKAKMQEDMCKAFKDGPFKDVKDYIYVGEGWFADPNADMPPVRPGLRADRKECILALQYFRGSSEANFFMQEFRRKPSGKFEFGDPKISKKDEATSRMNFFEDHEKVSETLDKMNDQLNEKFEKAMMDKLKEATAEEFEDFMKTLKAGNPDFEKFKKLVAKAEEVTEAERKRINMNLLEDTGAD